MHVPWTAVRTSFRYGPGDKVHEIAGPNIAGGFRRSRRSTGRHPPQRRRCCANKVTGSPAGRGISPTAKRDGASQGSRARAERLARLCPRTRGSSSRTGRLVDGGLEVTLVADGGRDHTQESGRASTAGLGARRRLPHHRLRPPLPGHQRLLATRNRAALPDRRHHRRLDHSHRSTSRPSSRAHPSPPVSARSTHGGVSELDLRLWVGQAGVRAWSDRSSRARGDQLVFRVAGAGEGVRLLRRVVEDSPVRGSS